MTEFQNRCLSNPLFRSRAEGLVKRLRVPASLWRDEELELRGAEEEDHLDDLLSEEEIIEIEASEAEAADEALRAECGLLLEEEGGNR